VVSPIAILLLALAVLSVVMTAIRAARKPPGRRAAIEDSVLPTETITQIEHARKQLAQNPELLTSTVRSIDDKGARRARRTEKENEK